MSVIRNYETIAPTIFIPPCLDIRKRYFCRIPEVGIDAIVYHNNFLVFDAICNPQCIHGILGYAMIGIIRESEDHAFE